MRPDSPGPALVGSACFVPTWLPRANASSTSASQPNVAVFQWAALQPPMRAATLRRLLCLVRNMTVLLSVGSRRPSLGGIREGVVEGIERAVRRDRELEAISAEGILDRDRERVF